MGCTPRIPPLEGVFCVGVIVVTFADMMGCVGGSRGRGPCKDTMGSRAAARASSSGSGSATAKSLLTCSVDSGPQVV